MVDIETLGLEPGCIILSIGAVEFNANGIGDEFYRNIDIESCQDAGLTIDAGTLDWWMKQDDEVKKVLTGGDSLEDALSEFNNFYYGTISGMEKASEIWANSPSFDCEILDAAYQAVGKESPWKYYNERCFRTLNNLPIMTNPEQEGNKHDALDDARHQANIASLRLHKLYE